MLDAISKHPLQQFVIVNYYTVWPLQDLLKIAPVAKGVPCKTTYSADDL